MNMTQREQHRIELLEAEIRKLRQALRILADAVIAGDTPRSPYSPGALARRAKVMLDDES